MKRDRVTLCLFCAGAGCRYCQSEPTPPRSKAKPAVAPFVAPPPPPSPAPVCRFCGGDFSAPDHERTCDGRQGGRDDDAIKIQRHRESSIHAFYNAINSGSVKTKQQQVFVSLTAIGDGTCNEVCEYIRRVLHQFVEKTVITPRFAELRDLGILREVGERACTITGETCITWRAIPATEHRAVAIINRCPRCNQIVSRDLRTVKPEALTTA